MLARSIQVQTARDARSTTITAYLQALFLPFIFIVGVYSTGFVQYPSTQVSAVTVDPAIWKLALSGVVCLLGALSLLCIIHKLHAKLRPLTYSKIRDEEREQAVEKVLR